MTQHTTHDATDSYSSRSKRRGPTLSTGDQMTVQDIQDAYDEYAKWIDHLGWLNRLLTGRYRRRQFSRADGRVLDVACGAGMNFRYLPDSAEIVGIDISEPLVEQARAELDSIDRVGTVTQMDGQDLDFATGSFDTVISSFSTCTFPDRVAALREMARVCRSDGQILLLEHGRSDNALIKRYQEWRAEAHYERSGCRLTQEPLTVVRRAGLTVDECSTAQFGRIKRIVCSPDGIIPRRWTDN
jgi:ubiquinone/menaquinone biosynthesis C-methylase UbiE